MKRILRLLPLYVLMLFLLFFTACQRVESTSRNKDKDVVAEDIDKKKENTDSEENIDSDALNILSRNSYLTPFAKTEEFSQLYGYMDSKGKTVIEPQFKEAEPFFDCGVAIVTNSEDKVGLIDRNGNYIAEPKYSYFNYSEGLFITFDEDKQVSVVFDETGKKLFETNSYIYEYTEGLAIVLGSPGGYLDKSGNYALTLDYDYLGPFVNGLAQVSSEYLGPSYLIDKKGTDMTDKVSSGLRMFKSPQSYEFGYMNSKGETVIPAQFSDAQPFINGYAIVGVVVDTEDIYGTAYGVIDVEGNFVLEPVFTGIKRMKNGLFSVGEELISQNFVPADDLLYDYCRKAVFSPELEKLSDWDFYIVEDFDENYICVSDGKTVSFYDKEFKKARNMPEFEGHGFFKKDGKLLRGELNHTKAVADQKGNILAGPENIIDLGDGIKAQTGLYSPSPAANFVYPVLSGIKDEALQIRINTLIELNMKDPYKMLTSDALINNIYDTYYTLARKKDLLIIDYTWHGYGLGGAHGSSDRSIYYINLKNGDQYQSLTEIIKPELQDEAFTYLSEAVSSELRANPDMYWTDRVLVIPETRFILTNDGIIIYYGEYEISAYAAGMPEFFIPYSDISEYIDTESDFWKAFN